MRVKIVLLQTSAQAAEVFGEVKVIMPTGMTTIAHVATSAEDSDTFDAPPGRYVFHFRVSMRCILALCTEVNGQQFAKEEFDATEVTAGRRYIFEVPA